MAFKVEFTSSAYADLQGYFEYYALKSLRIASSFSDDLQKLALKLARFPNMGSEYEPGVRRVLLQRFWCWIYYRHAGDRVIIFAILHCSRSTTLIDDRIEKNSE